MSTGPPPASADDATARAAEAAAARSRLFKRGAHRLFDDWSRTYDRSLLHFFLFRPAYLVLLEELHAWRAEHAGHCHILDAGCGTGEFAALVRRAHADADVVGLDYVPAMCRIADRKPRPPGRAGLTSFVAGDCEHLPFDDGRFDLVTCSNSFHHYPHQQAVVREFRRVLRPGGRLVLIDGFRDNIIGWVVFDVIVTRLEGHVHHATWRQVRDYFEAAGFRAIRRRKFNLLFPALATIGCVPGESPGPTDR